MTKTVATILIIGGLSLSPIPDDCLQTQHPRANPGLCYEGPLGRLPGAPGGGGPDSGGIIGLIGRALHGLTGGIL